MSQDGMVRVWAVAAPRVEVRAYEPDGRANSLTLPGPGARTRSYSPDGTRVVEYGVTDQGRARPAEFGAGAAGAAGATTRPVDHPEPIEVVLFGNDGSRFVAFGRALARAWDARTGEPA